MIILKKPLGFSIIVRLVCVLLIAIIPIYIISIYVYHWGMDKFRGYTIDSVKSQVGYYIDNIEGDIQRIKALQYDCINNLELIELAQISKSMSNYRKTISIRQLYGRLNAIKNSSSLIEKVSVHIPGLDRTIGNNGVLSEIPQERFDYLVKNRINEKDTILNYQNSMILNMVYPAFPEEGDTTPIFVIDVELSRDSLKKSLAHLCVNDHSGMLLITPGQIISASNGVDENSARFVLEAVRTEDISPTNNVFSYQAGKEHYLVIAGYSSYLNMELVNYISEEDVFAVLKEYKIGFAFLCALLMIIISFMLLSMHRIINKPLRKLVSAFRKLETGDFTHIRHKRNDEFGYLYEQFNIMVENLNKMIDQVYSYKILTQRSELKQLQSQINPHFLYNSFYLLYNMVISEDYDALEPFSKLLGNYFQYITRGAGDEASLFTEISFAKTYVDIQNQRFRSRISVEFAELPEKYYSIFVPKLLIQPIIENAFEHGLANKADNGLIRISFNDVEHGIEITVEDNGEELTDEKLLELQGKMAAFNDETEKTGILNVHWRLVLKMGESSGLKVERSELGGMKVIVLIVSHEGGAGLVQAAYC